MANNDITVAVITATSLHLPLSFNTVVMSKEIES